MMAVVTDRKITVQGANITCLMQQKPMTDFYIPNVVSYSDYYPGGMQMPGRNDATTTYRYGGAGGQETESEITGSPTHYSAEYWMYDSRLIRRWNQDPVVVAWESPYAAFRNNPIYYNDPSGLSPEGPDDDEGGDEKEGFESGRGSKETPIQLPDFEVKTSSQSGASTSTNYQGLYDTWNLYKELEEAGEYRFLVGIDPNTNWKEYGQKKKEFMEWFQNHEIKKGKSSVHDDWQILKLETPRCVTYFRALEEYWYTTDSYKKYVREQGEHLMLWGKYFSMSAAVVGLGYNSPKLMKPKSIEFNPSVSPKIQFNNAYTLNPSWKDWTGYMTKRGWNHSEIKHTLSKGMWGNHSGTNWLNPGNSMSKVTNPNTGKSLIIDNVTREIIQLGGSGHKFQN